MAGLTMGAHHICIKCEDHEMFEKSLQFYHGILGMEVVRSWGEGEGSGMMLDTGDGTLLEIFAAGRTTDAIGAVNHFALRVADVDACVKAVGSAGYRIRLEPKEICIASEPPYPARIAFAIGPCGEEVEFFCER